MAKKYQNVSSTNRILSIASKVPYYAYSFTVKPCGFKTLSDAEVANLVNFKPAGWHVSDVVDNTIDTPSEVTAVVANFIGDLDNGNPMNHDRYTDSEAVAAVASASTGGLWADRPTLNLYDGRIYFATDELKPLWYNSVDTTWYYADGTPHV